MGAFILFVISMGMAVDASNIGYDSDDVPGFSPGPIGWFFFALFLPILAVPIYLIRRPALQASAHQKRLRASGVQRALPGAYPGASPYGPPPGAAPYGGYPGASPYPPRPGAPYPGPPPQAPYGAPNPYGAAPQYGGPPPQAPYGATPPQPGTGPYATTPQPGTGPYATTPQPGTGPYATTPQPAGPQPGTGPYATTPQPPGPQPTAAAPEPKHASASASMSAGDLADGIRQLTDLRDRGLLTESEFQARKAALLRKI